MPRLEVLLGLLSVLGSAPETSAAPALEGAAGNSFRQLRSDHFVVTTDHPEDEARRCVERLERTRSLLLAALWQLPEIPQRDRTRVIVLAREEDLRRVLPRNAGASTVLIADVLTVIMGGRSEEWEQASKAPRTNVSVVKHELAHVLTHGLYRDPPRWFLEGLAQFAETVEPSADGTQAIVGRPNLTALQRYRAVRSIGLADILTWSYTPLDEGSTRGRYGLSWGVVHWLANTHPDALVKLQRAFQNADGSQSAWAEAFPGARLEDLEAAIHRYLGHGDYREVTVPLGAPLSTRVPVVQGSEADALAVEGLLLRQAGLEKHDWRMLAESDATLARALSLDPGQLDALFTYSKLEPQARLRGARLAVERTPEDRRAWVQLAAALPALDSTGRQAALRRVLEIAPTDLGARSQLATLLVEDGHPAAALEVLGPALSRAPNLASLRATEALALERLGRCAEAKDALQRGIELLDPGSISLKKLYTARLATLEGTCSRGSDAGTW